MSKFDKAYCEKAERSSSPPMGAGVAPAFPQDELGGKLKSFFDGLTSGPMPDRLMQLAAQLEAAVERGELSGCGAVLRTPPRR